MAICTHQQALQQHYTLALPHTCTKPYTFAPPLTPLNVSLPWPKKILATRIYARPQVLGILKTRSPPVLFLNFSVNPLIQRFPLGSWQRGALAPKPQQAKRKRTKDMRKVFEGSLDSLRGQIGSICPFLSSAHRHMDIITWTLH